MTPETFPHPGGELPQLEYKDGDNLIGQPVWFVEVADRDIHYVPDGRRKGKDRPILTRHTGVINHQIENLIRVQLEDKSVWLNLLNWYERRRIQKR